MADSRFLLDGLRAYHDGLTSHLRLLEDDLQLVVAASAALEGVFEGDSAEEFRQSWLTTNERFRLYLHQGALLARGLEDRLTALESSNPGVGDLHR